MGERWERYKPGNYYFLVPIVAFLPWYGMLISMLIVWGVQGRPIYWFSNIGQRPAFISDIGATSLKPLFISCAGWQGLGYLVTVALEFVQRSGRFPGFRRKPARTEQLIDSTAEEGGLLREQYERAILAKQYLMPPWYTVHERNFIFASFVFGFLGELALLMCSIFSTSTHHNVHMSMVVLFVILMCASIIGLTIEYFSMGYHYAQIHPKRHLANSKYGYIWNKFTISAIIKAIWTTLAIIFAICFAGCTDDDARSVFEWILAFWFGLLFFIISVDFYLGGRYMYSRYYHQVASFDGYYKYEEFGQGARSNPNSSTSTFVKGSNSNSPPYMDAYTIADSFDEEKDLELESAADLSYIG